MDKIVAVVGVLAFAGLGSVLWQVFTPEQRGERFVESEAGFEEVIDIDLDAMSDSEVERIVEQELEDIPYEVDGRIRWSLYWRDFSPAEERLYGGARRAPGPIRVGIQAGHWKNTDVPEELEGLARNGSGAQGGGRTEVDTVLVIAEKVKELLETEGIEVDLLPATIPVDYYADAFVSIHADGNNNAAISGFKIAFPRNDFSGRSVPLVESLYESYEAETGLSRDANVTRRMSGYYAFNWRRYDHALHPMTPAAIVETGFITNSGDRSVIVFNSDVAARGIAQGLIHFFDTYPVE